MTRSTVTAVTVGTVTIGEGMPKILVPIVGTTPAELRAEVDALTSHHVDIVEWRVDHFSTIDDRGSVVETAAQLSAQLGATPLLVTCRTSAEGGAAVISDEQYGALNLAVIESGYAPLVDVEYQRDRDIVASLIAAAHERGVMVITSNHDFERTPPKDEIVARLRQMQELGADICKIAVMPRSSADVLTLLDATREMHEQYATRPLITMSMGALGLVSRLAGQTFGSAATFGMVGTASAPGQVDADELHATLAMIARAQ
ncbi:type I 3-dehydroquinate dehydratase [Salinibacterium sp. ZJ454]|uniref:type I 3-dehydroquinate dehydratase n=1 Tax=Salinibacterium sp. ZJ454 TaxID=2708339 RepID=UPI001420832E|nr:type I 3-dehydroquinate dehydratase [Salinibacterium sp. ZJ454]